MEYIVMYLLIGIVIGFIAGFLLARTLLGTRLAQIEEKFFLRGRRADFHKRP